MFKSSLNPYWTELNHQENVSFIQVGASRPWEVYFATSLTPYTERHMVNIQRSRDSQVLPHFYVLSIVVLLFPQTSKRRVCLRLEPDMLVTVHWSWVTMWNITPGVVIWSHDQQTGKHDWLHYRIWNLMEMEHSIL